ncbi:MAG TPA: DUF1501 domain-containing protein [Nocardioides sp.]|nr:DUF1501 domain-containing protein [Nocardioides sp.]
MDEPDVVGQVGVVGGLEGGPEPGHDVVRRNDRRHGDGELGDAVVLAVLLDRAHRGGEIAGGARSGDAERVTLVTLSEFGRRVRENDDHGTDHGFGNVMFVAGAGWPLPRLVAGPVRHAGR